MVGIFHFAMFSLKKQTSSSTGSAFFSSTGLGWFGWSLVNKKVKSSRGRPKPTSPRGMNPCRVAEVAEFEAGFMVIYGRYIYIYVYNSVSTSNMNNLGWCWLILGSPTSRHHQPLRLRQLILKRCLIKIELFRGLLLFHNLIYLVT
jgi:hypothetical protein